MNHRRVRTDNFESTGSLLRVTGRQGYEASTDIWISRDMETKFEQNVEDTEDVGWNVLRGSQTAYTIPHDYTLPNLNGSVDLSLTTGGINNSLENVMIKPVGCKTAYNAYPKTQQKLLPYLIPFRQFVRQKPFESREFQVTFNESNEVGGDMPAQHWWDPTTNGDFVLSTHANATVTGDLNSVVHVGFCPRDMIQFGFFNQAVAGNPQAAFQAYNANDPSVIAIDYNSEHDQLAFNNYAENVVVRVQTDVLGGAPNAGNAHFFELGGPAAVNAAEYFNDIWSMRFDENGVAGRQTEHELIIPAVPNVVANPGPAPAAPGDPAYNALVWSTWLNAYDLYQEYLIVLAAYDAAVLAVDAKELWYGVKNATAWPNNNAKYTYTQNAINEYYEVFLFNAGSQLKLVAGSIAVPQTFGGGGNLHPELRLFLRRPRYSKGHAFNWSAHPGLTRMFSWYDKEISTTLAQPGEFDHFPEPTPFIDLARANVPKIKVKVGTWSVVWIGRNVQLGVNTERRIDSYVLNIDAGLWAILNAKAATDETCLILDTGPVVLKQANNTHNPLPVQLDQQRLFYVRFTTRQGVFAQGPGLNTITFNTATLSGLGGGNFGFGVPQTHGATVPTSVYPDGALGYPGWIGYDVPGQTMKAVLTQQGDGAQGMYNNGVTDSNSSWAVGRRPLLAAQIGDQFSRHTKVLPAHADVIVDGTELWQALDNMFQGSIYTEVPELTDYRTVRMGRCKNQITLKEPLFGLDSGMSTYRVNHIFKPRPWYNILLQDFDYSFQAAKTSNGLMQRDSLIEYTLEAERDVGTANGVVQQGVDVDLPVNLKLKNATKTILTIRSRDGLDQRTKLLENISEAYPLFKQYVIQAEGAPNPTASVSIYTERGVPDYFFIYAERDFAAEVEFIPEGHPIIVGLEVYGRTNKNKALSSYLNDKHEIWQATLRNSHPLQDDETLIETGGVLISKEDLGTLERDQFSKLDCFDYDLKIYLENEEQGDDETNYQETTRNAYPITIHVCCIYQDQLYLKGSSTNLSFVEARTYQ